MALFQKRPVEYTSCGLSPVLLGVENNKQALSNHGSFLEETCRIRVMWSALTARPSFARPFRISSPEIDLNVECTYMYLCVYLYIYIHTHAQKHPLLGRFGFRRLTCFYTLYMCICYVLLYICVHTYIYTLFAGPCWILSPEIDLS